MSIEVNAPQTIRLSGGGPVVNTIVAGAAIKPGMLIEKYENAGVLNWRPAGTAANVQPAFVALEQDEMNLTVDDLYAIGDLVKAWAFQPGSTFWGLVPSGQNVTQGDPLQCDGTGKLKEATSQAASAGVAKFQALEGSGGAVVVDTRLRTEVVA